jgi:hypothetical protein
VPSAANADDLEQVGPGSDVDAGRGLIEEQQGWPVEHGHRSVEAPLLASGKRVRLSIGEGAELESVDDLADATPQIGTAQIRKLPEEQEILHNGERRVDTELLRCHPEVTAGGSRVGDGIYARHSDPALVGPAQSGDDGDEGRLTGSVGPE